MDRKELYNNWKGFIYNKFGIITINNSDSKLIKNFLCNKKVVFTSRCSKTKGNINDRCVPKEFYLSNLLVDKFYPFCERFNIPYGIISDKYGILFMDEKLLFYDIHPSSLSIQDKKILGGIIKKKCFEKGYDTIVFYNTSPLMSFPYFEILYYSGLNIFYITKLPNMFDLKKGNKMKRITNKQKEII